MPWDASKELIHLHHGRITVSSRQWKGTTFHIGIPLGKDHLAPDELSPLPGPLSTGCIGEPEPLHEFSDGQKGSDSYGQGQGSPLQKTVLIIEDNTDLNEFLVERLQRHFQVVHTDNGITGIQMAYDHVPDLIISDIVLPGKDGLYITGTLKKDIRTSHIPIILLTARGEKDQQVEGMKTRADAYIVKPFDFTYLLETVNSVLKNREVMREHYISELSLDAGNSAPHKLDRKFINDFNAVVESNIDNEQFSIEDICVTLNISRMQLYRKVKAILNTNINDYILNARLKKAKFLLKENTLSITQVVDEVGFNSASYFSTVFKNKFGMTPKEFREK